MCYSGLEKKKKRKRWKSYCVSRFPAIYLFRTDFSSPVKWNLQTIGKRHLLHKRQCWVQRLCNTTPFLIFVQRCDGEGSVIMPVTFPKGSCWQPSAMWYSVERKANLYWTKLVPGNLTLWQPTLSYPQKQPIKEITAHYKNLNTALLLNWKKNSKTHENTYHIP